MKKKLRGTWKGFCWLLMLLGGLNFLKLVIITIMAFWLHLLNSDAVAQVAPLVLKWMPYYLISCMLAVVGWVGYILLGEKNE